MSDDQSNILSLLEEGPKHEIHHTLQNIELQKIFKAEKFVFITYQEDGGVSFYSGRHLDLGDITYLQKVMNVKCDEIITESLYPPN